MLLWMQWSLLFKTDWPAILSNWHELNVNIAQMEANTTIGIAVLMLSWITTKLHQVAGRSIVARRSWQTAFQLATFFLYLLNIQKEYWPAKRHFQCSFPALPKTGSGSWRVASDSNLPAGCLVLVQLQVARWHSLDRITSTHLVRAL